MENVEITPIYDQEDLEMSKNKKKIITITPEEFLAMANGANRNTNKNFIFKQLTGKLMPTVQTPTKTVKRIVMKKNKIIPISPSVNVSNFFVIFKFC